MSYKLGSLFDGSGGFPLAGALCGIEPIWASEVEPYPIAVTKSRFKKMKHLGDISKVNGAEIEPVDIITFGSPCQDLSVAGKRAGLKHHANGDDETTRSGLFMEAVRIIKEMRKATNGQYPKYCIWENVPGAFSSNKGEDFRIVLEELIKIVEPSAVMPEVPQKGWPYADCYSGDGWSIGYRTLDAQYWGVPQRRRRIYLVADFGAECAKDILFEREGLRGYFTQGRTPWQTTPSDAQGSTRADDREGEGVDPYNGELTGDKSATLGVNCGVSTGRNGVIENTAYTLKIRSGCEGGGKGALVQKDKSGTLMANNDQYLFQPMTDKHILDDQGGQSISVRTDGKCPTLRAEAHGNVPCAITLEPGIAQREGGHVYEGVSGTLRANAGDNQMAVAYSAAFCPETGGNDSTRSVAYREGMSPTLRAGFTPATVYGIENHPADSRVNIDESGKVQTLTSRMGTGGGNVPMVMEPKAYEWHNQDSRITGPIEVGCTINTNAGGREGHLILEPKAYGVTSKGNGDAFVSEERHTTLSAGGGLPGQGYPCVAYGIDPGAARDVGSLFIEEQSKTITNGSCPGHHNGVVVAKPTISVTAGGFTQVQEENAPTLMARAYKDPTCITAYDESTRKYIVRRLTPTECARLQGFADRWGDIDHKTFLTDEEYKFWCEVYLTKQVIDGTVIYNENGEPYFKTTKKPYKDKARKQMLTWYNKLHSDGSEYKMWGNGIALPTALFIMQGIADALSWAEFLE